MVMLFHNMMHKEIEIYVDDMIAKSKEGEDHHVNLKRLFDRLKKYKFRLNLTKCTFSVRLGKLMGFMVSERGIEVDPDKVKAIMQLPTPSTVREQWKTKDTELVPYHEYLEELIENFEKISFTYMPRIKYQFADALATLASIVSITKENLIEPLEIEIAKGFAHCGTIQATDRKLQYQDIKHFLQTDQYPPFTDCQDRRTIRRIATHYFLSGETFYRRSFDATLLQCVDENEAQRQVHEGSCGPHMNGFMLARIHLDSDGRLLPMDSYLPHTTNDNLRSIRGTSGVAHDARADTTTGMVHPSQHTLTSTRLKASRAHHCE
ncbi:hypothetical protein CRG98_003310 [Punica granatum]|uniref:Reverse transcriptase domain-containing protein n=1 Tax=Punica granatum TaxID=22663 RepID=A0A2I0L6I6_PUNGR|nr:hypothetical protein CRG98_003310 [Punica granatum]